jgi:hypothetical protein
MPSIATRYGTEPSYPILAMPLPEALPRPAEAICGDCPLWKPLAIQGAVAGRCTRTNGRPGIIGKSVAACSQRIGG